MSKSELNRCSALIDDYLRQRATLRRLFLLIDSRRGILPLDQEFMHHLDEAAVAFQIIMTKTDKLPGDLADLEESVFAALALHPAALPAVLWTSSVTRKGIEDVRKAILDIT